MTSSGIILLLCFCKRCHLGGFTGLPVRDQIPDSTHNAFGKNHYCYDEHQAKKGYPALGYPMDTLIIGIQGCNCFKGIKLDLLTTVFPIRFAHHPFEGFAGYVAGKIFHDNHIVDPLKLRANPLVDPGLEFIGFNGSRLT